jgi:hypothetical protein
MDTHTHTHTHTQLSPPTCLPGEPLSLPESRDFVPSGSPPFPSPHPTPHTGGTSIAVVITGVPSPKVCQETAESGCGCPLTPIYLFALPGLTCPGLPSWF